MGRPGGEAVLVNRAGVSAGPAAERQYVMQPENSHRGRTLLAALTLVALALRAIKLGSRGLFLHRWPTAGQWGQLGLVTWLVLSLWEGKDWARVACALYYTVAAVAGTVVLFLTWPQLEPPLRLVSILIVVLAGTVSAVLWFSETLRSYMAGRRAAQPPAGAGRAGG